MNKHTFQFQETLTLLLITALLNRGYHDLEISILISGNNIVVLISKCLVVLQVPYLLYGKVWFSTFSSKKNSSQKAKRFFLYFWQHYNKKTYFNLQLGQFPTILSILCTGLSSGTEYHHLMCCSSEGLNNGIFISGVYQWSCMLTKPTLNTAAQ